MTTNRKVQRLAQAIRDCDAVLVGVGSGMSSAAGLTYSGPRFDKYFSDFRDAYGITDIYSGGFYPFPDPETYWAWWSRHIYYNRYDLEPVPPYTTLRTILEGRDWFILTTNVDHQLQIAGFDKKRIFYTQGDYGLLQCSVPCHDATYDNEDLVRRMVEEQSDMRIPTELIPYCPRCGAPMVPNLRSDASFVEDKGWHAAADRYTDFIRRHQGGKVLYLELGVGYNSPGVIKYPFWSMAIRNPESTFASVGIDDAEAPLELTLRSICIDADIRETLDAVEKILGTQDASEQGSAK